MEPAEERLPRAAGLSEARYSIGSDERGPYLAGGSAPNLRLRVELGLTITPEQRRHYPPQTIFLDGAYGGPPFLDNTQRQYSFDHHAGCVRAFTLATCEQAAVMLLKGLPLFEGEWQLYLNDPDLDAVLAAWLLLNHAELLQQGAKLLAQLMPLVRVEGVIDGHGLDVPLLTALPRAQYEQLRAQLDALRPLATAASARESDTLRHTRALLCRLDETLFPAGYLQRLLELHEVAHAVLPRGKLAVLCRSRHGIYEVESQLKQRYERSLALIVLDQGGDCFTLRQVDAFLPQNLNDVYRALNHADARVEQTRRGANRWGGSDNIGGSPRQSGSALGGDEVLRIAHRVLGARRPWWRRLFRR
ncbi:MAG: hypothetical protein IPG96_10155 [Proteobacteria bacterium]|nr:hypothetical protein [Pseudomonadota bacterium]